MHRLFKTKHCTPKRPRLTSCRNCFQIKVHRILVIVVLLIFCMVVIFSTNVDNVEHHRIHHLNPSFSIKELGKKFSRTNYKYLINTPACQIQEVDPFSKEVEDLIHPEEYTSCSKGVPLLTYIRKHKDTITLNVNRTASVFYSYFPISCCYAEVQRISSEKAPDDTIRVSDCVPFEDNVEVSVPIVYVTCKNILMVKVYSNVHAIISPKFLGEKPEKANLDSESAFSVLLVGIDSVSKGNLARMMPKLHHFVENNTNFINMKGYSKIGLNTLPNLMGMLAGLNLKQVKKCRYLNFIDECYNIWKIFKEKGYITAYGEDATTISTFNYEKDGFHSPPTDFYFRPYILAAEQLGIVDRQGMSYCAGPETEGERIMNLIKDFQSSFKNEPTFGLFFMNSFSHDDINMPAAMDSLVEEFLKEITKNLNDTIMFFFSDHGLRFGEIRMTYTGWLEERTPFFYVHLPEKFKKDHPQEYKNVLINSKRLTNPYDIYMTLQDILLIADKNHEINQSLACPLCHSLFKEISEERSCEDAAIDEPWCVCKVGAYVSLEEPFKSDIVHVLIQKINERVSIYKQSDKCQTYQLDEIKFTGVSQFGNLLLRVKTRPEAIFEGSFVIPSDNLSTQVRLTEISRLDRYEPHSRCINNSTLEMYCYCKLSLFERILCTFSYC